MSLAERVRSTLQTTLVRAAQRGELGQRGLAAVEEATAWTVERPKRAEHGDLATNVALVLSKKVGMAPRAVAEVLVGALAGDAVVRSTEIAGPGFVNLRVHPSALHAELADVLRAHGAYGRAPSASGERIDVEFVSANPTGPITVAAARNAIFGDAVGRLLEATGSRVTREYYINDFGNQVRLFADSVAARAAGRDVAEDGYRGAYVDELARYLKAVDPACFDGDVAALARTCVATMLRGIPGSRELPGIRRTLADLGVHFDVWFSEESLHRWGAVPAVLRELEDGGHLVEKDGALFFALKDAKGLEDKDRVVRKSNGEATYFASDIAYLGDKVSRGYDRLLVVLGADHHGYVPRLKNALTALGLGPERFEALLYQLVFILRDGQVVKSSKRAGNVVTADEVMDEIDDAAGRKGAGRDAIRFFFLSRSANVQVDFDLDLAKKKSLDNPVFYVQYGHARLSSILRKAAEIGFPVRTDLTPEEWTALAHPDELALAQRISEFPAAIADAAAAREPHRMVFWVQDLARDFQSYYTRLDNEGDPILPRASERAEAGWEARWNGPKTTARLAWIEAIREVYAAALGLLGVSAPDRMDRPQAEAQEAAGAEP